MNQHLPTSQEGKDYIKFKCDQYKPLVAIKCNTFNHESYIRDALEGFVMQQTDFPFVAIVHDDASTDNTAEIIREYAEKYPNIILPILEDENQYSKQDGSLTRIVNEACNATGAKYVAYCEGDDYWTDPLKLQKQVDFLESHPDCSLCFHNTIMHWEDGSQPDKIMYDNIDSNKKYTANDILIKPLIQTATVIIRKEILLTNLYNEAMKGAVCSDNVIFQTAAYFGYLHGFTAPMSIYRIHPGGITNIVFKRPDLIFKFIHQHERKPVLYGEELRPQIKELVCELYFNYMMKFISQKKYRFAAKCMYRSFVFAPSQTSNNFVKYIMYKIKHI